MRAVTLAVWDPARDLAAVAEMGLRFITETPSGLLMGGEPTLARVTAGILAIGSSLPGTVILARDECGVLVGFAALVIVENPFTGGTFVDETGIWVEPEARRDTFAGPMLIDASEEWARQMGAPMLKMTAPPRSGFGRWLRRRDYELAEEVLFKRL